MVYNIISPPCDEQGGLFYCYLGSGQPTHLLLLLKQASQFSWKTSLAPWASSSSWNPNSTLIKLPIIGVVTIVFTWSQQSTRNIQNALTMFSLCVSMMHWVSRSLSLHSEIGLALSIIKVAAPNLNSNLLMLSTGF